MKIDISQLWTAWAWVQEHDMKKPALCKGLKLFQNREDAVEYYEIIPGTIMICLNSELFIEIDG